MLRDSRHRLQPWFSRRLQSLCAALAAACVVTFNVPEAPPRAQTGILFADDPPAKVDPARDASQRKESETNLRKIALAMHNYHDTHNHFPMAVIIGPDGKTPHSWRVELLPLLDQKHLYDEYKMDEPWDSESNKKVLAKMPPVFLDPADTSDKTNSSYYVLVGKGTMFEKKDGTSMRDVTDGTSTTLLVVEAKRDIPWTKPEDIAYDGKKDPPKLGGFHPGGFHAAICDGSVQFVSDKTAKDELKYWIEMADGHPIKLLAPSSPAKAAPKGKFKRGRIIPTPSKTK